ncbi:major facilitator superfamily domain-containing protein [Stachybotrys elegans]|uniref:Major facilitator superfamily domain-containing protein n=1 Tax=Stachybotrys elegans TaxID=80388 RepID=A0A8K0SE88_9HYPO|nr:major facilitator superfamily domain-containing protein [Stachybotrys elegans]
MSVISSGDIESTSIEVDFQHNDWKPSRQKKMIMATLSVLALMVSLDASIIVTSLAHDSQGFWIGTSYLLANAVSMPLIAALSDIFGRRACLVVSLGFFTLGSIICCLSRNLACMLVGRCLQGVGGGGVIILSLVIFTDIVPLRFRPKWYGTVDRRRHCTNQHLALGLLHHATILWLGLLAVPWFVSLQPRAATMGEKLKKVDWLGTLFFTTSYPHAHRHILGRSLIWTLVYEYVLAPLPFLRLGLFSNVGSATTYICGAFQGLIISDLDRVGTDNRRLRLTILWDVNTTTSLWVTTLVILGVGHGSILNAQNFAAQAMCRPGEEGLAAECGFQQVGLGEDTIDLEGPMRGFHAVFIVFTSIAGLAFCISFLIKKFQHKP